jgi:hypothetical protein
MCRQRESAIVVACIERSTATLAAQLLGFDCRGCELFNHGDRLMQLDPRASYPDQPGPVSPPSTDGDDKDDGEYEKPHECHFDLCHYRWMK